nr:thioredoxin domain-containing protein [uncultured Celeribacter sp.]
MNRRNFMLTTALAAIGTAGALTLSPAALLAQETDDAGSSAIAELVLGDPDAPVELIEYASYTCPHCANFHSAVFEPLKKDYIDTGKVRFVYREVYFDKFGLWAAMVARCAGDMRYFGVQKMLYDEQRDWIAGGKDTMQIVENLRKIGKRAGLTDDNLDACLNDGEMAEKLYGQYVENMDEYGIDATPTLVINGEKFANMDYAKLQEVLDAKLEGTAVPEDAPSPE